MYGKKFSPKEVMRDKINNLSRTDLSHEDSAYSLAKKEDEIRKKMQKTIWTWQ